MPIGIHPRDGSEVVKIPGSLDLPGSGGGGWRYRIGRLPSPAEGGWDDPDPQDVLVDRFAIQTRPVSNASYRAFVDSEEFRDRGFWDSLAPGDDALPWGPDRSPPLPRLWALDEFSEEACRDHPVVGVSWLEACAYARWCGGQLPSEVQWEVAASYHFEDPPRKRRYPWGDGADGRSFQDLFGRVPEADLWVNQALIEASRNPTSCCEMMIGFHWEWCREWYDEARRSTAHGTLSPPGDPPLRSVRGGCTQGYAGDVEAATRFAFESEIALDRLGFRCVFDWNFDEGER